MFRLTRQPHHRIGGIIEIQANIQKAFRDTGYLGPVPILSDRQCKDLANALRGPGKAIAWPKGRAPESRLLYEVASDRKILDILENLLGPNLSLFAASVITRAPRQVHPWHTDIETAHSAGDTVSVWIGLEHTNAQSSLQVISHSHALEETIQQVATANRVSRADVSAEAVVEWAKERDPRCEFVNVEMSNGLAVFFDGRLWHGSDNTNPRLTRTALLLQYATPDFPARIPDSVTFDWPFAYQSTPKPPCIMVRGTTDTTTNDFVSPPNRDGARGTLVANWVRQLEWPLAGNLDTGWKAHPIFKGRTRVHDEMSCHVSVLEPGHSPHPPHQHPEEEILIVLGGKADLISVSDADGSQIARSASRGDFGYYPSGFLHTIRNSSDAPITYLMFKWIGREASQAETTAPTYVNLDDYDRPGNANHAISHVMEGSTRYLRRLHCHVSTLAPGGGYDAHVDAHDVAIVVLEGAIEVMGDTVRDHGVVYFSAGEPHDMRNVGNTEARYVVFEFHSEGRLTDMGFRYNAGRAVHAAKQLAKRFGAKKLVDGLRALKK